MQNNILKVQEDWAWAKKVLIFLLSNTFSKIRKVCLTDQ